MKQYLICRSQIGRCNNRNAFRNQQYLQRAMEEAKKLVTKSPLKESSRAASPIEIVDETGSTLKEILKEIKQDIAEVDRKFFSKYIINILMLFENIFTASNKNLMVQSMSSRSITPTSILNHIQKPPDKPSISPILTPTVRTPVKIPTSPSEIVTPSHKPQSPEQSTFSKSQAPKETNKPATPDFSLIIEPATPVRSRPVTPEPRLIEEIEASFEQTEDENQGEEVPTEELIDLEIPKTSEENVDEVPKASEENADKTPKASVENADEASKVSEDTDEATKTSAEIVVETAKEESSSKTTKRRAPTPTPSDTIISRPVAPERPADQGMIPPPPPTKPKAPPPPVPETKVNLLVVLLFKSCINEL